MTYIDIATTIAIWTYSESDLATTSVSIQTDFLSAGKLGETIKLVARCDKIGKRLTFSSCDISSFESG